MVYCLYFFMSLYVREHGERYHFAKFSRAKQNHSLSTKNFPSMIPKSNVACKEGTNRGERNIQAIIPT